MTDLPGAEEYEPFLDDAPLTPGETDVISEQYRRVEQLRIALQAPRGDEWTNRLRAELHHLEFVIGHTLAWRGTGDRVTLRDGRVLAVSWREDLPLNDRKYSLVISGS